jgi:excisionase family DNA binding protein
MTTRRNPQPRAIGDTISVQEAGRRLGLGKNASYEAAARGEIPALRFGRLIRVPRIAFEAMLANAGPLNRRSAQ